MQSGCVLFSTAIAVNWCVAEWRRLESIYGNAGLAARITQHTITKMNDLVQCLKECNTILDSLRTADYRFVAWIIYSTQHSCFVAGVDTYSNDEQNLQYVAAKGVNESPLEAMLLVYQQIIEWEEAGEVPVLSELFS